MKPTSSRLDFMDAAKCIGILLVVLGHCTTFPSEGLLHRIPTFIYSFHMPLFFIISGFFLKPLPLKDSCCKYLKIYIKPNLVVTAIVMLTLIIESTINGVFDFKADVLDVALCTERRLGPIWFLYALFGTCFLYQMIYSCRLKTRLIIIAIAVALGTASSTYLTLPFHVQSSLFALVFVEFGRLMREKNLIDKVKHMPWYWYILPLLIFIFDAGKGGIDIGQARYNPFHFNIIGACIGSLILIVALTKVKFGGGGLAETPFTSSVVIA